MTDISSVITGNDAYQALVGIESVPVVRIDKHGVAKTSKSKDAKIHAVHVISKAYKKYSMRKTFQWLKENLQKSETSITFEILRRLNPKEAEFLKDPTNNLRIRFRFGGESFPPLVLYKMYSKGSNVHYFSGNRIIQPGSQASMDSCSIMGNRVFHQNALLTQYSQKSFKTYEPYQVDNKLEFIQYMNSLDDRPAYLGGRNNGWRELSIASFSSQFVQYDIKGLKTRNLESRKYITKSYIKTGGIPVAASVQSRETTRNQKRSSRKQKRNVEKDLDFEEEFGMLFEWTNHLSFDHLQDYTVT